MEKRISKYSPNSLEVEEYKSALYEFMKLMYRELIDNHDKGGRSAPDGWLWVPPKQLLGEIYYHTGKLQEAIRAKDLELIIEYSADVANLALMVADNYKHLTNGVPHDKISHPIKVDNNTI